VPGRFLAAVLAIALSSVVVAGCTLDESGPLSSQVNGWITTYAVGAAIGQLKADSRNVDLVLAHRDSAAGVRSACALLTTDAQTAAGVLPAPKDATLTNDLDAAYQDAAAAGTDCFDGANGHASLLTRSAHERQRIAPLLETAYQRIEADTGQVPSTSTTAPTGSNGDPFAP
jgi:hypothetical protein